MKTSKTFILLSLLILISLATACSTARKPTPDPNFVLPTNIIVPTQVACSSISSEPTPGPNTLSVFPPITNADFKRGPDDALITIMDYSDYQDPGSGELARATKQLYDENPKTIRIVSRPYPIYLVNDKAAYATVAVEAAAEQGKFWELNDLLYA